MVGPISVKVVAGQCRLYLTFERPGDVWLRIARMDVRKAL